VPRSIYGKRCVRLLPGIVFILTLVPSTLDAQAKQTATEPCRATGTLVPLDGVPEASGLAASRKHPGRLWTLNDSGQPQLTSVDAKGAVTGTVRLTGASLDDWEALAVGPCPAGSCLFVGDIGDNDAKRRRITIYRLPEPDAASGTAPVSDVFHATYPDGAHDAEALLVAGDGTLYIVTKGDTGPVALYRFPRDLRAGAEVKLERVGQPLSTKPAAMSRITDGSVSPDGQWVALRTQSRLAFHRSADLFAGRWNEASHVDLAPLREPQGEGVALGARSGQARLSSSPAYRVTEAAGPMPSTAPLAPRSGTGG
jgi:hypothetical protein